MTGPTSSCHQGKMHNRKEGSVDSAAAQGNLIFKLANDLFDLIITSND